MILELCKICNKNEGHLFTVDGLVCDYCYESYKECRCCGEYVKYDDIKPDDDYLWVCPECYTGNVHYESED